MKKVITYGTYDLLHFGHIRLLERAKNLGDYLIVGVTADDFDKTRGKINVQQSLIERIEAVRATGLANEIIVEEYEGQKIDDIRRLGVDIFTVGSDWTGKFDYLKEYCEVVYLSRTEGVSSSEIRAEKRVLNVGLIGYTPFVERFYRESSFVNGIHVNGIYIADINEDIGKLRELSIVTDDYEELLKKVDAVYVISSPSEHYKHIKLALQNKVHVLCEAPVTMNVSQFDELSILAAENSCILMSAIRTAYSTAYSRLLLLVKTGVIGDVVSVDATCTTIRDVETESTSHIKSWNSICTWGPAAMLPVFQILGVNYVNININSSFIDNESHYDTFSKIDFEYENAVASIKVGKGVKSESDLIISGTKGYVYVPAPWWKTDYFEIRFENPADNKRYFYQLDGEGIRYEIVAFTKAIEAKRDPKYIEPTVSRQISCVIEKFQVGHVRKINHR